MTGVTLKTLLNAARPTYRLSSTYERMLGTEVELQVVARTRAHAEHAEDAALSEIERLTRVFNRFDPTSELSRWQQRGGTHVPLSLDLLHVLRLADHWRALSGGAFHPGADAFGQLWRQAADAGQQPTPGALARQVSALRAEPWTLHADGSATLHARYPIGLNAIAKGYIVDCAATVASRYPGVRSVLVNAGGDLRVIGGAGVQVRVADPFTARDDAPPLAQVRVRGAALATSGSAHRGLRIGERWYSHVIDPRTGAPVQDTPGVTVTAPECAAADALATALSVLAPCAALALVNDLPGCEALIVTRDGQKLSSDGWRGRPAAMRPAWPAPALR
ncbi:FAD:protein FMN transferase [Deinococcus depolymerans]|uniref:FAD:protein FMN transferase n=1 Tax=Deinococcus depolymerans TaxID=392408 RepID=A0ABP3MCD2_9DEIO